jgi:hypothetical protein
VSGFKLVDKLIQVPKAIVGAGFQFTEGRFCCLEVRNVNQGINLAKFCYILREGRSAQQEKCE